MNTDLCNTGNEISTDLLQVLQKKLDDAVLDALLLTLKRNSMSKLSSEDVQVRRQTCFFLHVFKRFSILLYDCS